MTHEEEAMAKEFARRLKRPTLLPRHLVECAFWKLTDSRVVRAIILSHEALRDEVEDLKEKLAENIRVGTETRQLLAKAVSKPRPLF